MKSNFDNADVKIVSDYLQYYMTKNEIQNLTADECAELLSDSKLISNKVGPKPGFNFRQMLRDGRDGKIDLVIGAEQEKTNSRWKISKMNSWKQ
jgi:hypothetical protein